MHQRQQPQFMVVEAFNFTRRKKPTRLPIIWEKRPILMTCVTETTNGG
jgi:hypothetical protein